jgi:hypothetical protein
MAEGRVRGFSIATKCATLEELIEKFRDRVDETSILVNTVESRDIGTECAFAILLADKKVALAGTCTVMAVFTDANNPFKRPGMQLAIKRLGPQSEGVFAQLLAKRIAPRRLTTMIPVLAPRTTTAVPAAVQPRTTQPIRGLRTDPATQVAREPARRLSTVQIPPPKERPSEPNLDEPLARAPRATPFHLEHDKPKPTPAPAQPETRTPGSSYILPANPLSNLTDASLEGFVDCKLIESLGEAPATFATGTHDELMTVAPSTAAIEPVERPSASTFAVPTHVEPMRSEPLPLPPPPPARPTQTLGVYQSQELPKLDVGPANDSVRANTYVPLVPRKLRMKLLLAVVLLPLLGAAAVVTFMQLTASTATAAAPPMPATLAVVDGVATYARANVEPAPAAPVQAAPSRPQPIHAVLIRTYPIAARVVVGGLYFGTTPTYVKVPANTPVDVQIARRGFKPVTYKLTSKKRTDRVFVRLQRATKGRK